MTFFESMRPIIEDVMSALQKELRAELSSQGHKLTGKLSESIEYEVSEETGNVVGRMVMEDYGLVMEFGVTADRIPFSGSRGNGGQSAYIQGLINFWELRGLSGREAISAAFATAHVHAREGMPTRASLRHSSTGERTGFIKTTLEKNILDIEETIGQLYGARLELQFADALSQLENIELL